MSTVPRWPSVMIPIKRPWKLTAGYPKWLALEKVKFPLNMVIVCIYVRFLRCKHRPFLLAPQRKNLRVLAFDHLFGVRKGMVFLNTHRSHSYLGVRNMVILGCWSFRKKYAVERNRPLWVCICNILWPLRDSIDPSCVYMIQVGDFSSNPMDPLIILRGEITV